MPKDFVSIIVPVYNSGAFLERTISSILSQTYRIFELLLIDDGSTDASGDICDAFAKADKRIRVFHNTNHGVSASRNFGLQHAKGDWVIFIDSDDWLDDGFLNGLITATSLDTDFVYGNMTMINDKKESFLYETFYPSKSNIMTLRDLFKRGWVFVIGILFRKHFLDSTGLLFPTHINYTEDIWFMTRAVCLASSVKKIDSAGYFYNTFNNASITHLSHNPKAEDKRMQSIRETIEYLKEAGLFEGGKKEIYWRILVWKSWITTDPSSFSIYKKDFPEADQFIFSNPFLSFKMKTSMYFLSRRLFFLNNATVKIYSLFHRKGI